MYLTEGSAFPADSIKVMSTVITLELLGTIYYYPLGG
jgi:hypothetical protein